jgi:2-C-methyl-D-erythritol 4-phosphate cytidylyltransferase
MSEFSIIITAGGIGKRMGTTLPKQFLEIGGKPILIRTLEVFHAFDASAQLIITLPNEWKEYWKELLDRHNCSIPHEIVDGGKERYDSIKNALKSCSGTYVAVHDGVRPFVSQTTLANCFEGVKTKHQVVPVLSINDSIRQVVGNQSQAVDRNQFFRVQTPQCFLKTSLEIAYQQAFHKQITDDASLVEQAGFPIYMVDGNEENIKITSQIDLILAEEIAKI